LSALGKGLEGIMITDDKEKQTLELKEIKDSDDLDEIKIAGNGGFVMLLG
jgi:hypothetical protein